MRNILVIACFLISLSIFSQEKNDKEAKNVPASIFTVDYPIKSRYFDKTSPLRLTRDNFFITDESWPYVTANRLNVDFRNFGRHFSYEDLADNYNKAKLFEFDVSKNTDHYIWNISWANKQW